MKIAMVGQFPPHFGGVGVHIHTLAKKLVSQGHEVYVITYPHKNLKDIDGIHVIGVKSVPVPGLRGLLFAQSARKALEELVNEVDIDIIHGHYLFPAGYAAVKVGKKYNIPTYVTAHGSDMFEVYAKQSFMRPVLRRVLSGADVVLAVSDALKEEIVKTGVSCDLRIHLNSVNVSKFRHDTLSNFKSEIGTDKPVVLFVGNIIKRKNVNALLEARKRAKTDYTLAIVGDGPLLSDLKAKVKKENIPDVYFAGARNDVEKIIPAADILVLPSFSESFGLVLIEALACGVPVIGSNVGGIREIITPDVGLLIEPDDFDGISSAIDKLISDESLHLEFKSNARDRAMDFSKVKIPYDEIKGD